jgi:streptogramin lyase
MLSWTVPTANAGLQAILLDEDGIAWFAESTAGQIGKLDPSKPMKTTEVKVQDEAVTSAGLDAKWQTTKTQFSSEIADVPQPRSVDGVQTHDFIEWLIDKSGQPVDLASGSLWFAEQGSNKIGRFQLSGPQPPTPVGGYTVAMDKLAIVGPYVALLGVIAAFTVTTVVLCKRNKRF